MTASNPGEGPSCSPGAHGARSPSSSSSAPLLRAWACRMSLSALRRLMPCWPWPGVPSSPSSSASSCAPGHECCRATLHHDRRRDASSEVRRWSGVSRLRSVRPAGAADEPISRNQASRRAACPCSAACRSAAKVLARKVVSAQRASLADRAAAMAAKLGSHGSRQSPTMAVTSSRATQIQCVSVSRLANLTRRGSSPSFAWAVSASTQRHC
eukprot:scaffold19010_cov115-Isochrysis_galbana.AAC.3